MVRRSAAAAAGGLLILGALWLAPLRSAAAQDAQGFINTLGTQAIQVLGPSVPEAQRIARFRELFRDDFDMPGISQFVLGRYWRVATPQEQQEFLSLFQEYLVRAYSARLGQYGGEPFHVTGSKPAESGETEVTSQIIRLNGGAPIEVDWYLTRGARGYKIVDVYVGGVSMAVTQRDEFASVIQRSGGVSGLLAQLRQKLG